MSYKQKQTARLLICMLVTAIISVLLTILFMTNGNKGEKPLPDVSEPDTSQGSDTSEPDKSQGSDVSEPDESQDDISEPDTPTQPAELTWEQVSQYLDDNESLDYSFYSPNYENNNVPAFVVNRLPDNDSVRIIVPDGYQVTGSDYITQDDDAGETFKLTVFIDKVHTTG